MQSILTNSTTNRTKLRNGTQKPTANTSYSSDASTIILHNNLF